MRKQRTYLMAKTTLPLYEDHFVSKQFERLNLFEALVQRYPIRRVLYPGCFVHVTPSFVIPHVTYVDTDRRCPRFFRDQAMRDYVAPRRQYAQEPEIQFLAADFTKPLDLPEQSFDLLLSQWTTPTCHHCKRYLRVGGILVANNSHGDASLASLDPDYELIGVVTLRSGVHKIRDDRLDQYFVPKSGREVLREDIERSGRGAAYTKSPTMYIFRRVG